MKLINFNWTFMWMKGLIIYKILFMTKMAFYFLLKTVVRALPLGLLASSLPRDPSGLLFDIFENLLAEWQKSSNMLKL